MTQLNMFTQKPSWRPPTTADLFSVRDTDLVAFDTETRDPRLKTHGPGFMRGESKVLGVSVAVEREGEVRSLYIPLAHYEGNVENQKGFLSWLCDVMLTNGMKIGANIIYDLAALYTLDIELMGHLYDVQVMDALIDETLKSYSLESIAQRRLKVGKDDTELKQTLKDMNLDMGTGLDQLHAGHVAAYAIKDAELLLPIYHSQQKDISELGLNKAMEMETKTTRALWMMHKRGFRIDEDKAHQVNHQMKRDAAVALAEAQSFTKIELKPFSSRNIGAVLDTLGIQAPRTVNGNHSINNEFLAKTPHGFAIALAKYRKTEKIRRDYVEGLFIEYASNGRVYPQWFQNRRTDESDGDGGASTGRITGTKPNLTQIPSRDPYLGPLTRSLVLPEEGMLYGKFDYSSQEPRIAVHLGVLAQMKQAKAVAGLYNNDKKTDFHQWVLEVIQRKTGLDVTRRQAKDINLGIMYGMGIKRLCEKLGISEYEAESIIRAHRESIPFLTGLAQMASDRAQTSGTIRTLGGRLRQFNTWEPREYGTARRAKTHKALNAAIQGSAADQMRRALIRLCIDEDLPVHLQVYDEVGVSVESMEQAQKIAQMMEEAMPMSVPSLVAPSVGENWGSV